MGCRKIGLNSDAVHVLKIPLRQQEGKAFLVLNYARIPIIVNS
ncbi:hypothetical protein TREAZ_0074 [Leadbettera azotonutricia ZAS-9]|uniref:Uncharacterized protein n=1 Tax=Leadbettera azotonutricia (strain ATCC BAA-888 / DSM 13862 / ZAS-9) TaxID=545695 RepID=F5YFK3_LEAAZ|nr:hypothetical protein TREAZ_0074 [Leadbettera azotonutricia ZAS-9]